MYKYEFKLDFKVENCLGCPFRHERFITENIMETDDRLSGTVGITRKISNCVLKNELITFNDSVDGYTSKCPLKGNILYIEDNK